MTFQGSSPFSIIRWRASLTHLGQSESVTRGQPRVGLVFCQDFCRGLSDHLGMNDSLGLNWLKNWMALKAPLAMYDSPFSTYFIGLCMVFLKCVLSLSRSLSMISFCNLGPSFDYGRTLTFTSTS